MYMLLNFFVIIQNFDKVKKNVSCKHQAIKLHISNNLPIIPCQNLYQAEKVSPNKQVSPTRKSWDIFPVGVCDG